MDEKVRLGRWVLILMIAVTAVSELTLAGLSLQAGRFSGGQALRVLLTAGLFWKVWDGAGWARWLTAGLFLVSAAFGAFLAAAALDAGGRLEVVVLVGGLSAVCLAFGLGLASPWVAAYQSARRGGASAEEVAAAGPLGD
jgi:hypothetical protein